jgi:hypothetical protein
MGQQPTDSQPPAALPESGVTIESLPGGAKISYDLPSTDNDISYVKAEYIYKGEKRVVRSSIYNNYLIIEGMGAVEPLEFTLYVVDHSGNVSAGVTKSFTPDTPLWETIFESVQILPNFSGVSILWKNESATEIGITVFSEDSTGVLREGRTQYSDEVNGDISFWGYDPVECRFAVRITDKWGNTSGIKDATVVPLFEKELEKRLWSAVELPGDNTSTSNGRPLRNCWDGNDGNLWHTLEGQFVPFPMFFTIDFGEMLQFSKMRLMPRAGNNYCFNSHTFRRFEVWGSADYVKDQPLEYWVDPEHGGNNGWQNDGTWEKLGDFEVRRPSGLTTAVNAADIAAFPEDIAFAQAGFMFNIPIDRKPLRYIRFVMNATWGSGAMHMAEFYFHGDNGSRD